MSKRNIHITSLRTALVAWLLGLCSWAHSTPNIQPPSNIDCIHAMPLCESTTFQFDDRISQEQCANDPLYLWFTFTILTQGDIDIDWAWNPPSQPAQSLDYQLVQISVEETCSSVQLGNWSSDPGGLSVQQAAIGTYYLIIEPPDCYGEIEFTLGERMDFCYPLPCENCVPSFSPLKEGEYIITAWAKESTNDTYTDPFLTTNYDDPKVLVEFPSVSSTFGPFHPAGLIIDGWQRIEGEFTVPATAETIRIRLSTDGANVLFDDVRVFPKYGSMKGYVYDPHTQRLVAELDERHYATLYEYDDEGNLVRVKKETERGIMTVQEQRANSSKITNQP